MKKIFIIRAIICLMILLPLFTAAQPPVKLKARVTLEESDKSKLAQLQPMQLQDTLLKKKGYTLYRGDAFDRVIRIPVDKMKKFTLKELEEREQNCGYIPMQSPLFFQRNMGQTIGAYKYHLQNVSGRK